MQKVLKEELDRIGKDEPIDLQKVDLFGTLTKAKNISSYINRNWEALMVNNAIGIKGDWGSGKSSVVKTIIDNNLLGDEYNICTIDAWRHEDTLDVKLDIFDAIVSHSKGVTKDTFHKGVVWLAKGAVSIANDALTNETGIDLTKLKLKKNAVDSMMKSIKRLKVDKKTIIVVDNVDRMAPENLVVFINSIKTLFGFFAEKNIVFLVLFDEDYLIHSFNEFLKLSEAKSTEYIQKIFSRTFELVPIFKGEDLLFNNEVRGFISSSLNHNPRSILKFINMYSQIYSIDELQNFNNVILTKIYYLILKLKYPLEFKKLLLVDVNTSNWNKNFSVIIGSGAPRLLSSVGIRLPRAVAQIGGSNLPSSRFIKLIYSTCPSPSEKIDPFSVANNVISKKDYATLFKNKLTSSYISRVDFNEFENFSNIYGIFNDLIQKI